MLSIRSKAGVDESVNTMRVAAILTERSKYPDRTSREEFHKQQELEAESVCSVTEHTELVNTIFIFRYCTH